MNDRTETIRTLNDRLRTLAIGGSWHLAGALVQADAAGRQAVIRAVMDFDAFTPDNDPHGEHDFGSLEVEGERVNWKIDYYSPDMEHGSEDPADVDQTRRVLTICYASDY